jgi:hypothetical protein
MKTYYFNTGVKPFDHNPPAGMAFMDGFKDSGNGVYVIPFDCEDVPENARFLYSCDTPIPSMMSDDVIVREIHNSKMMSKYAFFKLNTTKQ